MSREIKFRAWDKKNKKMSESFTLLDVPFWIFDNLEDGSKRGEVIQFIGLKDKNGKEIYEGYILGRKGWGNTKPIRWFENLTRFVLPKEFWKWEVIGNLYENPESINGVMKK